jgi:hypothetical protein
VTPAHDLVYEFPPDDLLPALIDRYFEEFNVLLPLLYRPGFEKKIAEGLHLTNERFAAVLLLVSAIGSAFVDDLRVKLNGARFSNGWKYFNQVHLVRKSLLAPPTLYDMQIIPVSSHAMLSDVTTYRILSACSHVPETVVSPRGLLELVGTGSPHGTGYRSTPEEDFLTTTGRSRRTVETSILAGLT